jgi:hypothetical protein
MSRNRRLELIEGIEKERKSKVIAYVLNDRAGSGGSIGPDSVEEMYRLLCELKPLERTPLDLFFFAHQGDMTVPWQLVGMIRELFDLFNVIIPHKAHGAATMIALGADAIIMGERGTLSPIEVLIPGDSLWKSQNMETQGLSVEDAKAAMSLMESFGRVREKQKIDAFLRLMDKIHPLLLGSMHKQAEQIRMDCLGLLEKRKRRFSTGRNRKIVNHLVSGLASSHHAITRSEAVKQIGLKQVRRDKAIEPLFWELLTLYEEEFTADEPFHPEAPPESFEEEERVFPGRKIAFMESARRTRILIEDRKVQKIRETAPSIRLDPQIILPALQISDESSEDHVWSYIEGWLQANLPALLDEAFSRFRKSLPVSGYKWTSMNRRWVDE